MYGRRAWLRGAAVLTIGLAAAARAELSIARQWDEACLAAIRVDLPRPPVHARNLFHLSVAMYDAWAAYDPVARGYLFTEKIVTQDVEGARAEAISYAAYRVLRARYARSVNSNTTFAALDGKMASLGYDTNLTGTAGSQAYAVGNRIAQTVLDHGLADGANEANNYRANDGYVAVNEPLIVAMPDIALADPNRWQPLALAHSISQNGIPVPEGTQTVVCPHWGNVKPFALLRRSTNDVYEDKGLPPQLGGATDARFKEEMLAVLRLSSYLDPGDTNLLDSSPHGLGNNSPGANDGAGYATNPVTGLPYVPAPARRGDFGRVLAEYWADGPQSETPPGHWNVLANHVSDSTTVKRIGGAGPVVSDLEWDVKLYFGLNGAAHDAAVAAWNHKGRYDSVRPISAIRYMASKGQCSDTNLPLYHPEGLPLAPGLVTINVTRIYVRAWPGEPANPTGEYSGVQWVWGQRWTPYQKSTFVTPAFPGFTSGHSTFSRAGAEFLARFTGSPWFPGGLFEFVASSNSFLTFERGPSADVRLQFASYYDAADQAGQSRLWGGIHIQSDDFCGRRIGADIGAATWDLAAQYFAGAPQPHPVFPVSVKPDPAGLAVSWPAITGRQYRIESGTNLAAGFQATSGVHIATDISMTVTSAPPAAAHFFRVTTENGL